MCGEVERLLSGVCSLHCLGADPLALLFISPQKNGTTHMNLKEWPLKGVAIPAAAFHPSSILLITGNWEYIH